MTKSDFTAIFLIAIALLIASAGTAFGDTGVPAVPEIQGLATATVSDVVGTVTESDSGSWTTTNDPLVLYTVSGEPSMVPLEAYEEIIAELKQLQSAGGSLTYYESGGWYWITQMSVPQSLLNQQVVGAPPGITWQDQLDAAQSIMGWSAPVVTGAGLHTGVLDPGQVQYTAGYNDQYAGVSGQQTFAKSMALSTGNKIADQSNIKASTSIQFIAVDTGRATRTEDLLVDGASQAQDSSSLILCPFANANPGIIPAFCNIEQAGSAFDTTLTSTVTSADTRFVGTDATIPTVLNYNINAQGITLGTQSSPMIGSVSAYLKVHVQEARNESTVSGSTVTFPFFEEFPYSFPDGLNPQKSEDLVYSETSSASGLISKFSKSMSYSSQASAVPVLPVTSIEIVD